MIGIATVHPRFVERFWIALLVLHHIPTLAFLKRINQHNEVVDWAGCLIIFSIVAPSVASAILKAMPGLDGEGYMENALLLSTINIYLSNFFIGGVLIHLFWRFKGYLIIQSRDFGPRVWRSFREQDLWPRKAERSGGGFRGAALEG